MIISEKHSISNHVYISASNLDWEQSPLAAISDMKTLISRLNNNKCKQMEFFSEQLQSPNPIYYLQLILRRFSSVCYFKIRKKNAKAEINVGFHWTEHLQRMGEEKKKFQNKLILALLHYYYFPFLVWSKVRCTNKRFCDYYILNGICFRPKR